MSRIRQVTHGMRRLKPVLQQSRTLKEHRFNAKKAVSLSILLYISNAGTSQNMNNWLATEIKKQAKLLNDGVIDESTYNSRVKELKNFVTSALKKSENAKKSSDEIIKNAPSFSGKEEVEVCSEQPWYSRFYDECKEFVSHPIDWTKEKLGIGSLEISEEKLSTFNNDIPPKVIQFEEPQISCDFANNPLFKGLLSEQVELPAVLSNLSEMDLSLIAPELVVDVFSLGEVLSVENVRYNDSVEPLLKSIADIVKETVGDIV